jgi:UDP-N-acetylmuramoyl-L-alanyl-D-glutamate--2,6-diaminopimelate ligase
MKLRQILPADAQIAARDADIDVRGVTADSRAVKPGDVFVAVAGSKTDGLHFIGPAVAAGAVAVLAERSPEAPLPAGVAFVRVSNARRTLALAAAKLYPRQPQTIAAVGPSRGKSGPRSDIAPPASARSAWFRRAGKLTAR